MAEELLDFIQKDTGTNPRAAVIWLHGLGADGHDFEPIVPELGLTRAVRFIFPHAPTQPVTINGGMVMRAWYDITAMDLSASIDARGIHGSSGHLRRLIRATVDSGIRPDRIVLAGFSQGGVIALHTGLIHTERLAGIVALSTYVALPEEIQQSASDANRTVPIFMAHGRFDPVIPCALGERSRDFLVKEGYPVQWYEYPMEHSVFPDEIRDLADWLNGLIDA
ncbi:MAG: carboxylesterase [Gammaproteobacteria bacterium]|nr:carboxylesterase [Gammaproteobacteria bacterium]